MYHLTIKKDKVAGKFISIFYQGELLLSILKKEK